MIPHSVPELCDSPPTITIAIPNTRTCTSTSVLTIRLSCHYGSSWFGMVLYPPPTRMWKHCPECGIRLTREVIDTLAPGHEPWCIVCSWKGIVGRLLVADASSRISCCQEQVQGMQQMQQTLQQQQQQMQQLQEMQEQMQEQLKQMQEHMQQGWQSVASLQDQIKQLEEQQWRLQYNIDEVQCHHRNTRLELLGKAAAQAL